MYYFFSLLFFIISPITGVIFSFLNILSSRSSKKIFLFICLTSVLLGILNSGKVPENDLLVYQDWFKSIENFSLGQYLLLKNKEPLFFMYNYIVYYLTGGSFMIYIIVHTFLCYSLMGYSLYRVHSYLKFSQLSLLISLLVLFLFPTLFSLSAHLLRQFLAAALLLVFSTELIFYKKKNLFLFLGTILIHTSSIIYGILYLLRRLDFNKIKMIILILFFTIFSYTFFNYPSFFLPSAVSSSFLTYGLEKIQNRNTQFTVEIGSLGWLNYLLFTFILLTFYRTSRFIKIEGKMLLYLSLLFIIFITVNYYDSELSMRFSFYLYFLFPVAVYLFIGLPSTEKILNGRLETVLPVLLVLLIWFIYNYSYGTWEYSHVDRIYFITSWK